MQMTEPDLVEIELDTYWVKKGGEDRGLPAAIRGRVPLIHLK
jgi:hypothetical protein